MLATRRGRTSPRPQPMPPVDRLARRNPALHPSPHQRATDGQQHHDCSDLMEVDLVQGGSPRGDNATGGEIARVGARGSIRGPDNDTTSERFQGLISRDRIVRRGGNGNRRSAVGQDEGTCGGSHVSARMKSYTRIAAGTGVRSSDGERGKTASY